MFAISRTRLAAVAAALCFAAPAMALDSVKMMIPANPGGGWDQTGRNLGAAMQAAGSAKSIQYDNKGGAAGTIGLAQFVNSAKGDGSAVMIGGMVMVGGIILNKSTVTLSQVTPIARLTGEFEVLVVPASSPIKDMKGLVAMLKANPGSVSWGGGSAGGTDHLLAGMIARASGVDPAKVNYIPYKGGGEAVASILGGQVTVGVSGWGEFAEHVKSGKMRAIALSSPARIPGIEVPTLKEQGIDVELFNWRGIFAGPGITPAQKAELIAAVEKAVKSPAWQETLKKFDWLGIYIAGDEFAKYVEDENKRIGDILGSLGLKK
ncbi:Bug family tripartite tricarboxylate transporter substrate binding protein [Usitatibacter palustris]|uniref:Tricarboxylic transport membrane protein n=1 Tax=Usitatibacter palustris TaxID=2732487 RepID=A0A6M4H819_9PROT|nr:tripartite tricarboxylate transporter substrate binding protein [Usitatibacter palustris]QJR14524.1 hypothetical protein DSM104440_01325 [Usitatibacter palustris]